MADSKLLKFIDRAQAYPSKRTADERTHDFLEIARPYIVAKAEEQAARCSQCGVPFCQVHCPLHNNIPDWLKLTAEGRLEEAYELSAATSTMPEICGRICPQDRLCEGNCVIEKDFGSVTIGSVEKFITDTAWENGWVKPVRIVADRSAQSVGIIGAGPAGLTTAELLRTKGYVVHVYDRYDRAGGLLTYGIPGFKLEKPVVMRRVERLRDAGIVFHHNFEVGRDASMAELRARHDAILVATGVYKPRSVDVPGADSAGVVEALDYLTASNRQGFGDNVATGYDAEGKHVVVIGGGDTGWTAYALRSARAPPASNACTAATVPTCRDRCAKLTTPRKKASSSSGSPRRPRSRRGSSRPSGCGWARPGPMAAAPPKSNPAPISPRPPISSSRRWASTPRICRACSAHPTCR